MVAVDQTRFQVKEISGNKKHYSQTASYKVHILMREFYRVTNI